MLKIDITITNDLIKITQAMERSKRKVYGRQGAYLRTTVRNLLKQKVRKPPKKKARSQPETLTVIQNSRETKKRGYYRKYKGSPPGTPPYSWKGKTGGFKNTIFFDADNESVVIGPSSSGSAKQLGALHEYGGSQKIRERDGKMVVAYYPARPFMAPAFEAAREKIADFWKDAII